MTSSAFSPAIRTSAELGALGGIAQHVSSSAALTHAASLAQSVAFAAAMSPWPASQKEAVSATSAQVAAQTRSEVRVPSRFVRLHDVHDRHEAASTVVEKVPAGQAQQKPVLALR